MQWFRFYSEALDDPKVQLLPGELFKFWVNVLCLANQHETRGSLPEVEAIAFRLRIGIDEASAYVGALVARGLVDIAEDGTRLPHNWDQRQHKSDDVTTRVVKHRMKRFSNVSGNVASNVTETLDATLFSSARDRGRGETETETETETEGGAHAPPPAPLAVIDVLVQETADVLTELGSFIDDTSAGIEQAVGRSFQLVKDFQRRDGPVEAEKFVRYYGKPKKQPADWYRAWLNWLKRAAKDQPSDADGASRYETEQEQIRSAAAKHQHLFAQRGTE